MKNSIANKLSVLAGKKNFLVNVDIKKFQKIYPVIIRLMVRKKKDRGIYISFNKSLPEIKLILGKAKAEPERFFIIDAVSKSARGDERNNYCLDGPESLTQLSIILTQLMKTKKYDCILFDNLSSFLIYQDLEIVKRFIHYLIGKLQYYEMRGVFLSLNDKRSKELLEVISPFFDKRIDLTK